MREVLVHPLVQDVGFASTENPGISIWSRRRPQKCQILDRHGFGVHGRATSAFASAGLVRQRRGRVTELRVTIVVALGLAAVALWLSAAWLLIVRVIR
jgi:hypothetical protein